MKKVILGICSLFLATGLYAGGTVNTPIALTPDGTGDFVIGQAYFANQDGWSTNLRVLNTNVTASIVAKVSIADGAESGDLLDFAIYLTPGDVFEATIFYDASGIDLDNNCGGVFLTTSDDSLVFSSGTAKEHPQTICLGKGLRSIGANLNDKMGYIEVIGMAEIAGVKTIDGVETDFSAAPVNKEAFHSAYHSYNQTTEVLREDAMKADGWTSVGNNSFGLFVSLINDQTQKSIAYRGVAFENFMGGRVVSNYVISRDIIFNEYSDKDQSTLINELEQAILFNMVDFPYYGEAGTPNETVVIFTSVTKRERFVDGSIADVWTAKGGVTPTVSSDYCNSYVWLSRDMEENYVSAESPTIEYSGGHQTLDEISKSCTEMTYISIDDKVDYSNGMFSIMMFDRGHTIPAIPLILNTKEVQGVQVTDKVLPLYR